MLLERPDELDSDNMKGEGEGGETRDGVEMLEPPRGGGRRRKKKKGGRRRCAGGSKRRK